MKAFPVRPTVPKRRGHPIQQGPIDLGLCGMLENAGEAAHAS